jgi:hypothetical protein
MIENTWEPLQFIFFQHVGLVLDHPHGIFRSDDHSRAFLIGGYLEIIPEICSLMVNIWLMILNNMVIWCYLLSLVIPMGL